VHFIREQRGERFFLMKHGDVTFGIPEGNSMMEFSYRMQDEPEKRKAEADRRVDEALQKAARQKMLGGPDGFALCTHYCFNRGPFLRPAKFSEFVTPYLTRLIQGYTSSCSMCGNRKAIIRCLHDQNSTAYFNLL
jgi:uroporphyrinogen decarboxylase